MKLNVDEREFATILAALRYWRREGWISFGPEHDVATDGGKHEEMEPHEIEAMCYRFENIVARDDWTARVLELAEEQHADMGQCEIDSDALISDGGDNGAYVEAWVWVDFSGTDLDRERESEEAEE